MVKQSQVITKKENYTMEKKYEKCIKIKYNLEEHMQHTQHKVTQHNIDHKQTKK